MGREKYDYQRGVVGSIASLVMIYPLCLVILFLPIDLTWAKRLAIAAIGIVWSGVCWAILIHSRRKLRAFK